MEELFAQIADDLSALSVDELSATIAAYQQTIRDARDGVADIGERTAEQLLMECRAASAQVLRMQTELAERAQAEENFTQELDAIAAEAGALAADTESAEDPGDEDGDEDEATEATAAVVAEAETVTVSVTAEAADDTEPAETAPAEEQVAVTASAQPRRLSLPEVSRRHRPVVADGDGEFRAPLVAATTIRTPELFIREREPLNRLQLGQALAEAWHRAPRNGERMVVASAEYQYPAERRLIAEDPEGNARKIRAVSPDAMSPQALVASGGLCAPFTPLYDLPIYAVPDRPVRDSLATFQATRGGITYPTPLDLVDVTDGITRVTAAQDEEAGTDAIKNCVVIDCDPFTDAAIDAIAACVQWGNFNARAWPERVANVADLLAAAHAQEAETGLLNAIGNAADPGVKVTTDAAQYGALSTLLQGMVKAAAGFRSRHRMRADATLQVLAPSWLPDMGIVDLAFGQFDRFHARTEISGILARANISVTYYLDTQTGAGQVFDAQSDADTLDGFPATVVWYLFAPGTWLFLDGGRIDLGIVRDSGLNSTNDFEVFYETFEGIARVGIESIKVTSTVCLDGSTAVQDSSNIPACGQ